jgi:hypothetical protein
MSFYTRLSSNSCWLVMPCLPSLTTLLATLLNPSSGHFTALVLGLNPRCLEAEILMALVFAKLSSLRFMNMALASPAFQQGD